MQLRRSVLIGAIGASMVGSAFLVSPAMAQDNPPTTRPSTQPARDPVDFTFRMLDRMLGRLNLTDDQQQKVDALFADTKTKLNDILTDDQKQQLAKMTQRNGRQGSRRGPGGGAGGGGGGAGGGGAGGGGGGAPGQ